MFATGKPSNGNIFHVYIEVSITVKCDNLAKCRNSELFFQASTGLHFQESFDSLVCAEACKEWLRT